MCVIMSASNIMLATEEACCREDWSQFHRRHHSSIAVPIFAAEELERQRKIQAFRKIFCCFFRPFSFKHKSSTNKRIDSRNADRIMNQNSNIDESDSYCSDFGINLNVSGEDLSFPSSRPMTIRNPSIQFLDLQ